MMEQVQLTIGGALKKIVYWALENIIGRHIILISALLMLATDKFPGAVWAEALSVLGQTIMYAIYGSMLLTGFVVLLSIGFWLVSCLCNLGLWALHCATGKQEVQEIVY